MTPPVEIYPRAEVNLCYYFRTSNTVTVPVKRWVSEMTPDVKHLVMFTTTSTYARGVPMDKWPPGTMNAVDCGLCSIFTPGSIEQHWVYDAKTPSAELALPADDGAGNPVAFEIPPNAAGFLEMHIVNTTDNVVTPRVTLNAEALERPIYTKAATFITYDSTINIPTTIITT